MRILGIDPGLRVTGFGVIEKQGTQLSYIASGTVTTPADAELPQRLKTILESVGEIIATYRPDCSAIEKVFVNVNPQSTLLLGQARGAAVCALVSAELAVSEYTALQIKQAVVGHGKARKTQVQEMVKRLLSLPAPPKSDAADALGVAICHAHAFDALNTIQKAAALKPKSGFRIRRGRLIR
ncbi:MAG: crossover junction endodeoxyribonuclease RuvC [Burkholderiaceae bacterium]|jgi:crossover junction endodeoxyribonuclease RuvC|nr:crossover junction endodeoxyribonuclease RuvC [Burkholderiaceae bacterium]